REASTETEALEDDGGQRLFLTQPLEPVPITAISCVFVVSILPLDMRRGRQVIVNGSPGQDQTGACRNTQIAGTVGTSKPTPTQDPSKFTQIPEAQKSQQAKAHAASGQTYTTEEERGSRECRTQ
ncbi:hypothetical protein EWB00_001812, partial [Schistosoma japonicum]